jgi:hypothetical protein
LQIIAVIAYSNFFVDPSFKRRKHFFCKPAACINRQIWSSEKWILQQLSSTMTIILNFCDVNALLLAGSSMKNYLFLEMFCRVNPSGVNCGRHVYA